MIFPHKRLIKPRLGVRINNGHLLAKGLVGCWIMNEGAGNTVADLSGNRNTGTLVGDTHFVPGKFGPCLDFEGDGDYVTLGLGFNLIANQPGLPVSAWVKPNTTPPAASIDFVTKRSSTVFLLCWATNQNVAFEVYNASTESAIGYYTDGIADTNWHHVVGVYNGTNVKVYVDTIAGGTVGNLTGNTRTVTGTTRISGPTTASFNGSIDDVMIYDRALSASEIAQLYREPFGMFERDESILWQPGAGEPPTGNSGIMTAWGGYWGATY